MRLTKDTARLNWREWARLKILVQESAEFDAQDVDDIALLLKVEWHCADTADIPDNDDRSPPARNE